MNQIKNILVGISGTKDDLELLEFTIVLMNLIKDANIVFVNVGDFQEKVLDVSDLESQTQAHFSQCDCADLLGRVEHCVISSGRLDGLLTYSTEHEFDLIVVGRHKDGLLTRRLAMEAPCSVLSVGIDSAPQQLKNIGVAIDFSHQSKEALMMGISLAKASGQTSCTAIHVLNPYDTFTTDDERHQLEEEKLLELKTFVSDLNEPDFQIECILETHAYPWVAMRELAQNRKLDLLVLATRGLTRSAAILLGSVAEKTIVESNLALFVYKNRDQQRLGLVRALLALYRGE